MKSEAGALPSGTAGEVASPATELLVLCTGNAARSVMAGFMLETLEAARGGGNLHIVTGGTHTVDGQPMGVRTRTALLSIPELADVAFGRHRSRQVSGDDLARADLVVVMEADHVRYVRRRYPEAADRTATIRRLCVDLPLAPPALGVRVAALGLATATLDDADDVIDPAGGEGEAYAACVTELWSLCRRLIVLL
jgi:protein-tyrosine-phosphatase